MPSSGQEKPGAKSGRRKPKRSQKPQESQVPDRQQAAREPINTPIDTTIASAESSPAGAAAPTEATPPSPPVAEAAPAEARPADSTRPAESSPVGLQTIATAYRDYTRKSIQDAQSYVEKLSSVRSLDKAVEVQTEFAKQAYETFAADSRKIYGLYGEYFRQAWRLPRAPFDRPR